MKSLAILALVMMFSLNSCVHIFTKSNTYDTSVTNVINGAKISTAVKPKKDKPGLSLSAMVYMVGSVKLEGPFAWRIEAEGLKDQHTSMVVHRLKVETEKTNRKSWLTKRKLGVTTKFVNYEKEPTKSFAIYKVPGELRVDPKKDGNIVVYADITIKTNKKSVRKTVKFNLLAEQNKKETEFVFIPSEIVNSFGQKDPREWGVNP